MDFIEVLSPSGPTKMMIINQESQAFLGGVAYWDGIDVPQSAVRLRAGAIHQLGGLLSRFLGRGMAGVRVARTSARPVHHVHPSCHPTTPSP